MKFQARRLVLAGSGIGLLPNRLDRFCWKIWLFFLFNLLILNKGRIIAVVYAT